MAKVRELRAQAGRDPELLRSHEVRLKLEHYEESLAMLEETTPEHALVQKLRFELEASKPCPRRRSVHRDDPRFAQCATHTSASTIPSPNIRFSAMASAVPAKLSRSIVAYRTP